MAEMTTISGMHPELAAALRTVADATAVDRPKFSPATCGALTRTIVGRAFGKPMLELVFLLAIAASSGRRRGRYEDFFWNAGPAQASAFRAELQMRRQCGWLPAGFFKLRPDAAEIATDGEPFAVHYGRMPLLAALAEFLVTALGYPAFDEIAATLSGARPARRAAADAANAFSRALHGYLQPRLDTAHAQSKMQAMLDHLSARGGADAARIDDEAVLSFWLDWSARGEEGEGFRTFRSVAVGFLNLHAALLAAEEWLRLDRAAPIGSNREAGEIDPGAVEDALAMVEEHLDAVAALTAPPLAMVKFCTGRELERLATPTLFGRHGSRLVLSALRHDVFGDVQTRISQALRRGDEWNVEPQADYAACVDGYRRLLAQTERMLWASLAVLIGLEAPEVIDLIEALRPDLDLKTAMPAAQPVGAVMLRPMDPVERFLRLLRTTPAALGPELAELVETARRAQGKVARKGFAADDLAEPATAEAFRAAPPVLRRIHTLLARFADALPVDAAGLPAQFADDGRIFTNQFNRLYGGGQT
jgi:hypothetical protein